MTTWLSILTGCALLLSACPEAPRPDAEIDRLQMPVARDVNPDPNIVEVYLTAQEADIELTPGVKTRMWTYNGLFPGPMIEAKKGDRLIVHFTNQLPDPTTIHWHGVETPALMDGSTLSQASVAARGGRFTYDFTLLRAATYWYHPHANSAEQVERGLYGALIVRDPAEDSALGLPADELVLIFDDILLDSSGQLAAFNPADPVIRARRLLNGRRGSLSSMMVNGRNDYPNINVRSGRPMRLRMINAANSRFFRMSVPQTNLYRIGGDGGLLQSPVTLPPIDLVPAAKTSVAPAGKTVARDIVHTGPYSDQDPTKGVLLVPGERADIMLTPIGSAGESTALEWHDIKRGDHTVTLDAGTLVVGHEHNDGGDPPIRLLQMTFDNQSRSTATEVLPPASLRTIPLINTGGAANLNVTFGHDAPDNVTGDIKFFAYTDVGGTGIAYSDLTAAQGLSATIGQTYIWEITNMSMGDHPFHPHGFSFQPMSVTYVVDADDPAYAARNETVNFTQVEEKDTILIPGRPGSKGTSRTIMRLAVRFDDTGREGMVEAGGKVFQASPAKSGGWLVHCHILEHASAGMGTWLNLSP